MILGVFSLKSDIAAKWAADVTYIHVFTNNRHRLFVLSNRYIFYGRSWQKFTGWHNTVFTSLQGPDEVIKRAARVHRHDGLRNYAEVVARAWTDTSCSAIFRSTTWQNMIALSLDYVLCCKECGPWEETLKFEIFCENQKIDAGGDDKLWIQFAPP